MKWAVRLQDVKKEYPMGGGVVQALRGVTLGIPEGTARSDLHHARAALRRLLQNLRSKS